MDHLCYLCLVFVMLSRLSIACWERADLLALVCDVKSVLSLSHVVSWVRCGICLYRLLIFPAFLAFILRSTMLSIALK